MAKRMELREDTYNQKPVKIDTENYIVHGVRILGKVSLNGRTYSDDAMRQAATMYDGIGVNIDHPARSEPGAERLVRDGAGWLEAVRVEPDGVYGDLHLLKTHAISPMIIETAQRRPDRFGLSHNASGSVAERSGKRVVESIESVRSVDVVQRPATNKSLFESESPMETTIKKLVECGAKSALKTCLVTLLEMDGMDQIAAEPMDTPASGEDPVRAAAKAMLMALIDSGVISDDELMSMIDTYRKKGTDGATDTKEGGDQVEESIVTTLRAQLADRDATDAARALLEANSLQITAPRVAALKAVDKKNASLLIEDWKQAGTTQKTRPGRSPAALTESTGAGYQPAPTAEVLAKRLA